MSVVAGGLFGVNAIMHALYVYLMRAPSAKGRRLLDRLEGFKLYLEVAEQEDLNLRNPPQKTPELFEKYLPFAIALGVEQAWGDQFVAVFAAMAASGTGSYQPRWYGGYHHKTNLNDFTKSVGASMASAISSASTAPGSTSGAGGGGFSGGGGGGGGGGGW